MINYLNTHHIVFILIMIGMVIIFVSGLAYQLNSEAKRMKNNWNDLNAIFEKLEEVKTIEDIEKLYDELFEFRKKIYSFRVGIIQMEANRIEAYLDGMYRILKRQ